MSRIFTSIGNACTDIVASVPEEFLLQHGLRKHFDCDLQSTDQLEVVKKALPAYQVIPGGAGANVTHVISALGGESHFIGKISADAEGLAFQKFMEDHGIKCHFREPFDTTTRSPQVLALITPDGERTFASFDGSALDLSADDYDFDTIRKSDYLYLDGYCFSSPHTADGFYKAASEARAAGHHVTFNAGDLTHYEANKGGVDRLLSVCDSVMCSRPEAEAFFGAEPLNELALKMAKRFAFGAITDGRNGAFVFNDGETRHIPAADISHLKTIDTNGAGDHFSGGFIYGLMNDFTLEQAGRLGILCATDCLSHPGARPLGGFGSLKHLAAAAKS